MTKATDAMLRADIKTSCGLLAIHARAIAVDADKIVKRPPYEAPVIAELDEASRVLFNALHFIREAKQRIENLPVELQAAE